MKYYIAWKPTSGADVRYWEWFRPDGVLVSLAKLQQSGKLKDVMTKGIHKYLNFDGEVFLDGGAYGYPSYSPPYTQTEILNLQTWLRADLISHLDRPYVNLDNIPETEKWDLLRTTIENARAASRWQRSTASKYKIVYTVQGWNLQSVRECAEKLAELESDHYAIGSLIGVNTEEAVKRISEIRQILGKQVKIHLFGVSSRDTLERARYLVDSFDSATPAKAAVFKEIINPYLRRLHVDETKAASCNCPVCRDNPTLILAKGLPTQMTRFNFYRAIHNAYIITEYSHGNRPPS